jgi:hypothetical protein
MTETYLRVTKSGKENLLYFPVNKLGITHKDTLAQKFFLYINEDEKFVKRDKIISLISSGSLCYALEIENIKNYDSEFEIRVLIDYRNKPLENQLRISNINTYLTDLNVELKSQDILRLTNNPNGFDITNISQYEGFNPYFEVAQEFKEILEQIRGQTKNVFVPFGSGNLHQALQKSNLSGVKVWGCIPYSIKSDADKLTAKFRPFSNLIDVLQFDEDNLDKAVCCLSSLNLEPSALAGFATYNQYQKQMGFRPNETVIVTTGNSNNYTEVLRRTRLEFEIDKK